MVEHSLAKTVKDTHVVTCILFRKDQTEERMLLVQRSHKVGSYHEQWAGISGFIESGVTAEEQAYTEICEETRLQPDQVRILKRGKVVKHIDEALGRHFYIHPFLFEVLTPESVQTDWEAIAVRWIDPDDLTTYPTVPKLKEVYEAAISGADVDEST
jgi:8-oxo-dGTP diphosphatase